MSCFSVLEEAISHKLSLWKINYLRIFAVPLKGDPFPCALPPGD
jgi:hypothetical protein